METATRLFRDSDYPRLIEIANANFPDDPRSLEDVVYRDALWQWHKHALVRLVAEAPDGAVPGWGQINHLPHQFDPAHFRLGIQVDPASQNQNIGSLLHDQLVEECQKRGGNRLTVRVRADSQPAVVFLSNRGFQPLDEAREFRLCVLDVDVARCLGEERSLVERGIEITSLAAERACNPRVTMDAHALYIACLRDVPSIVTGSELSYPPFLARELEGPHALPEAHFLAVADGHFVALCAFTRHPGLPRVLAGRLTACLPEFRGRGIVSALKYRMARFAVENGFEEIWTVNSARNEQMIRINESIGFRPYATWLVMERHLS
jgi:GNAT superfamily N-acetyltransferase